MKNALICLLLLFQSVCWLSCKSYSKYEIDEAPNIKIDESLLGIWKAVEDTNKKDYILIQKYRDFYGDFDAKHDKKSMDPEQYAERKKGYEEKNTYRYYITRMDHSGTSPHYQQWPAFMSTVKNVRFLNIDYQYVPYKNGKPLYDEGQEGYIFIRIVKLNKTKDTLTTCMVNDEKLFFLLGNDEVRARITANLNNPRFYSDTLHFYKVSPFHADLKESMQIANRK